LKPINLVLKGANPTLELNHDGEDLAKKREQILENTKLLLEKNPKHYKVYVHIVALFFIMNFFKDVYKMDLPPMMK
jgi:hypothetical protein